MSEALTSFGLSRAASKYRLSTSRASELTRKPHAGWYHGIRMPGTNVPGVITAGTFYQDGKRVFWDVHHPEKTINIDLHDERYNELVVEVADPDAAVKLIQNAL